jgi:REP element-mobilizing transposase RayT
MEYRKGSHSLYDLKYHIVFCTKYRYRVLTDVVANRTRELIREISIVNKPAYKFEEICDNGEKAA